MPVPQYPQFEKISLDHQDELTPCFAGLDHGISEFSFAGIYLFRNTYNYHVAFIERSLLIIRGEKDGQTFYALPMGLPRDRGLLKQLLEEVDYFKGLSEAYAEENRVWFEQHRRVLCEDRDNFDYLYDRQSMVDLAGKKLQKKRNQVNGFLNTYPNHELHQLDSANTADARLVLDEWVVGKDAAGEYAASLEALEYRERLGLKGAVLYVDGEPVGYTMGETYCGGRMHVIHIEKARPGFHGAYQFLNQAWASTLPTTVELINREQDLGDLGLRQAKMTYRPVGFVKKYRVCSEEAVKPPFHTRTLDVEPVDIEQG